MKPLSHTPFVMPQSGIREIVGLATQVPGCIRLDLGEPNFPTPRHICDAAYAAATGGFTKYTPPVGLQSFREAISGKLKRVNGLDVAPGNIVTGSGATSLIFNACVALLEHGEEMLLPDPGWPNWEMMVLSAGGSVVRYPATAASAFLPEIDKLDGLVTPRTKAILLNSPSNPAGAVMPRPLVREMVEFARRHDLWVVSDECYDEFVFDGKHVCPAEFDTDGRVISVFSCSKTYAMTGWRVGYAAVPPGAIDVMAKLQQPVIGSICSIAQKAAEAAFLGPQDCVAEMRDFFRARRDQALTILRQAGIVSNAPEGAFFAMIDVSQATDDTYAFARHLVKSHAVSVAPGDTFGPSGRGLIRVSLATSEENLEIGLTRIVKAVRSPARAA
jgi:aspartate aminotransferase/aminotransferase